MRHFNTFAITTLVVVGLIFPFKSSAQVPSDTLAILAKIDREYRRLGPQLGPSIWPGFRPDTIPLVFVVPNRGSVLFGWRGALPNGYQAVNGGAWKPQLTLGAASTGVDLDGRGAAQVVVSNFNAADLLPTAVHEAFHVFERASVKPGLRFGRGENAFYVSSYPVFDVQNEKLFAMEGHLLQGALAAKSVARKRELAREFVAVRRARHRALDPNFAEFDRASELNEGLAEYALVKTLMAMRDDRSLPGDWRESARKALAAQDTRLGALTANVKQSLRLRFYSTGPAQALLLDQLAGSSWKTRLTAGNESLTDILAATTGIENAETDALARGLRDGNATRALATAERSVAELRALRKRQADSVLSQPGILLELSASELPSKDFGFCGFDPQNHLQISPTIQMQTRWWRPCSGSALSSEFNVPSIHDDEKGTVRAVIGAESAVKITVAGQPVTLADGQTIDSATDVRVEAPRASAQSARARLSRMGRTIRITPLPSAPRAQTAPASSSVVDTRSSIVPLIEYHQHIMGPNAISMVALPPSLPAVTLPSELEKVLRERERISGTTADVDLELYTSDAQILDISEGEDHWMRGRPAIKYVLGAYETDNRYIPNSYSMDGNTAYITGVVRSEGSTRDELYFVFGLKKSATGKWQIAVESATVQPPLAFAKPLTAEKIIQVLDDAGIKRAVVLSAAYWIGDGTFKGTIDEEYSHVKAENDWVVDQVSHYPTRLVAFCGVNPLREYALREITRCSTLPQVKGVKLHFGNSDVDVKNPAHLATLKRVFREANVRHMAIVVHLWTRDRSYGKDHARIFLEQLLPEAPDVTVQIAHLGGAGRYAYDEVTKVFADAVAAGDSRMKNVYFDLATVVTERQDSATLALIANRLRQIGLQRILFGSDTPTLDRPPPLLAWATIRRRLPLTDDELRIIANNIAPYMR